MTRSSTSEQRDGITTRRDALRQGALACAALIASSSPAQSQEPKTQESAKSDSAVKADPSPTRFEKSIAGYETDDQRTSVQPGGVLFVGSSSIKLWNLPAALPQLPVINRGFGGSHMSDVTHFAARIIIPYRPAAILVYAGDNDLGAGKTPGRVVADFQQLVANVRAKLPTTPIVFLSIKPSPLRWSKIEQQRAANNMVQEMVSQDATLRYVDLAAPLLDDKGEPVAGYFRADRLHLSFLGYHQWNERLRQLDWSALGVKRG